MYLSCIDKALPVLGWNVCAHILSKIVPIIVFAQGELKSVASSSRLSCIVGSAWVPWSALARVVHIGGGGGGAGGRTIAYIIMYKAGFPLGGILRAERNLSLSCDFSGGTNSAPRAKFLLVENGLNKAIFHCGRFARAGGATNFNHVKISRAGKPRKLNVVLLSWRVHEQSGGQKMHRIDNYRESWVMFAPPARANRLQWKVAFKGLIIWRRVTRLGGLKTAYNEESMKD